MMTNPHEEARRTVNDQQKDPRPCEVIAVDFDGVLCSVAWPDIGKPYHKVIEELIYRRSIGVKLILWTCRSGERLWEAIGWCKAFGLTFDAVNQNLPECIAQYGGDCRKISADEYWDDHAVLVRGGRIGV